MAKFDPIHVRTRLAMSLDDLEAGMVIQHPESGYRGRYLVIHSIGLRDGESRPARVSYAGGRDTTTLFPIDLFDFEGGYQVRPHFGLLRYGDVITMDRKRITVRSVRKIGDRVWIDGTFVLAGRGGKFPTTVSIGLSRSALDLVNVVEWGS